jgi:hypothetical protein
VLQLVLDEAVILPGQPANFAHDLARSGLLFDLTPASSIVGVTVMCEAAFRKLRSALWLLTDGVDRPKEALRVHTRASMNAATGPRGSVILSIQPNRSQLGLSSWVPASLGNLLRRKR